MTDRHEYFAYIGPYEELPLEMRAAVQASRENVELIMADFHALLQEGSSVEWAVGRLAATLLDQDANRGGMASWLAATVWLLAEARGLIGDGPR